MDPGQTLCCRVRIIMVITILVGKLQGQSKVEVVLRADLFEAFKIFNTKDHREFHGRTQNDFSRANLLHASIGTPRCDE